MALRLYLFVYFFGFAEEDTTVNLGITWCDWSCLAPDEYIWCYGKHIEVIPVVHTLKRTPFNIFTFRKFGAEFLLVLTEMHTAWCISVSPLGLHLSNY